MHNNVNNRRVRNSVIVTPVLREAVVKYQGKRAKEADVSEQGEEGDEAVRSQQREHGKRRGNDHHHLARVIRRTRPIPKLNLDHTLTTSPGIVP